MQTRWGSDTKPREFCETRSPPFGKRGCSGISPADPRRRSRSFALRSLPHETKKGRQGERERKGKMVREHWCLGHLPSSLQFSEKNPFAFRAPPLAADVHRGPEGR